VNARTFALLALLVTAACTPKESASNSTADAAPTTSATAVASATASAAPSAAPATADNDPLPSHGDVAKTVRGEITKQNYKTELEKLEKSADEP
jgi:hypothetical protein